MFRSLSESPSSRLHPRSFRGLAQLGSRIQLQQRNCSRFSRDFLRRSTFSSSQRTGLRTSGLRSAAARLFNQPSNNRFLCHQLTLALNFIVTGGAGFIGSNLTLDSAGKFPDARLDRDRRFSLRRFQESRRLPWRFRRAESGDARLAGAVRRRNSSTRSFISRRSPIRPITISSSRCTTTWKVSGES